MFFNFGFDISTYIVEIKQGNSIRKQEVAGDDEMAKIQFMQLVKETTETDQPFRVSIWKVTNKGLILGGQFLNKSYMNAFPNEVEKDT